EGRAMPWPCRDLPPGRAYRDAAPAPPVEAHARSRTSTRRATAAASEAQVVRYCLGKDPAAVFPEGAPPVEREPDKDSRRDARTGGLSRHEDACIPKRFHDALEDARHDRQW